MYDELIQRLREQVKCDKKIYPQGVPFQTLLLDFAADAIEDLQGKTKVLEKLADYWCNKAPKWIPVTERLPEQKKAHYLCLLDDDSMAVVYWSKVPDWASKGEWTWHNPNWKEVTHWMPLPQPPKEEI